MEHELIGDVDPHGAGRAVSAPAAEDGAQLPAQLLHLLQLLHRQRGGIGRGGHVLRHLLRRVHPGQDHGDVGIGGGKADGQARVLDGPAGQGLHVDEAHVPLPGPLHELRRLGLHDVVGEHDRLHPVQLQGSLEYLRRVGGEAGVADLPRRPGLHQGLQSAAGGADLLQLLEAGIVDLVEVYVVRAEVFQADLDVPGHPLLVPAHGLGGQDKLLPAALDGLADELLADRVAPGGVDVVDPRRLHGVQKLLGRLRVDALDGDASQSHPGDLQSGLA